MKAFIEDYLGGAKFDPANEDADASGYIVEDGKNLTLGEFIKEFPDWLSGCENSEMPAPKQAKLTALKAALAMGVGSSRRIVDGGILSNKAEDMVWGCFLDAGGQIDASLFGGPGGELGDSPAPAGASGGSNKSRAMKKKTRRRKIRKISKRRKKSKKVKKSKKRMRRKISKRN